MTTLHIPVRPQWRCARCWVQWPCASRRQELRVEYPTSGELRARMAEFFLRAATDLAGTTDAGDLYQRFMAWTDPDARPAATEDYPADTPPGRPL